MNKSAAEYSLLRYDALRTANAVATSFKSGGVISEPIYVQETGKRIIKFRCPPGTRRAGKWTDRLGTDCELGAARAGLNKISMGVAKLDTILANREIAKDKKRERRVAKRVALGQRLIDAAAKLEGEGVSLKPKKGDGINEPDLPKKGKLAKLGDTLVAAADKLDADTDADPESEIPDEPKKGKLEKIGDKLVQLADSIEKDKKDKEPGKDIGKTEGDVPEPKRTVKSPKVTKGEGKKPTGPAKAAGAKLDEAEKANAKNVTKKAPGKQFGGVYTNETNAKKKAVKLAQDEGQALYVVKGSDGKLRIFDEERFSSLDTEALFAIGPDGSIIDIDPNANDPADIIDDVTKEVAKNVKVATAEEMQVAKAGVATLAKSKTGQFLPDDLSGDDLEAYRKGATDDLINAFTIERDKNLAFWEKTLDTSVDDFADSEAFLTAIDKAIADEIEANGDTGNKKLGVMNAERKNFLAMWVPDEGMDDVIPNERINFVGPTRRHSIIEEAGLEGLVVSKKKSKVKKVTPDLNQPIDEKPGPDVTDAVKPGELGAADKALAEASDTVAKSTDYWSGQLKTNYKQYFNEDGSVDVAQVEKDLAATQKALDADKAAFDADPKNGNLDKLTAQAGMVAAYQKLLDEAAAPKKDKTPDDTPAAGTPEKLSQEWIDSLGDVTAETVLAEVTNEVIAATATQMEAVGGQNLTSYVDKDGYFDREKFDEDWDKAWADLTEAITAFNDEPSAENLATMIAAKGAYNAYADNWSTATHLTEATKALKEEKGLTADWALDNMLSGIGTGQLPPSGQVAASTMFQQEVGHQKSVVLQSLDLDDVSASSVTDGVFNADTFAEKISNPAAKELDDAKKAFNDAPTKDTLQTLIKAQAKVDVLQDAEVDLANNSVKASSDVVPPVGTQDWIDHLDDPEAVLTHPWTDSMVTNAASESAKTDVLGADGDFSPFKTGDSYDPFAFTSKLAVAVADEESAKSAFIDDPTPENLQTLIKAQATAKAYQENSKAFFDTVKKSEAAKIAEDPNKPDVIDVAGGGAQFEADLKAAIDETVASEYLTTKMLETFQETYDIPTFTSEEQIDQWFKTMAKDKKTPMKLLYGTSDKVHVQAYNDSVAAGVIPTTQQIAAVHLAPDVWQEFLKNEAAFAKQALAKTKAAEKIDTDPIPEITGKTQVSGLALSGFESMLTAAPPEFDLGKLISYESAKMTEGDLNSMISRAKKYEADYKKVLDALPENFAELTPQEQMKIVADALGTTSDLQTATHFARAAFVVRNGDSDSMTLLQKALTGNMPKSGSLKKIDTAIEDTKAELDAAIADLQKLPANTADPVLWAQQAKVATARNKLMALTIDRLNKTPLDDTDNRKKFSKAVAMQSSAFSPSMSASITETLGQGVVIKKAELAGVPKGMPSPTASFDSSLLGTVQDSGKAIAHSVPVGNQGMWEQSDADDWVTLGGRLADVPDAFLKDAIWANTTGDKPRFKVLKDGSIHEGGFNNMGQDVKDQTTGFVDTLTGKQYVMKTAWRNDQEHIQEVAGARVAQIMGEPTVGIKFGSPLFTSNQSLPNGKKALNGSSFGDERAIVMEHVGNLYGEGYTVYPTFHDIPPGAQIDGESLARLMALDRTMNYFDRTAVNVIPVQGPDGKVHLHPIDHGNAFQDFPGGPGKEMAKGFTGITKGDNIDLMAIVGTLNDEEKEKWAKALVDSVRRYQKRDFATEFTEIADTMKVSDIERQRLAQHAKWLEDRKTSLDWDAMLTSALTQAGFDPEDIDSKLNGGNVAGFAVPQGAHTVDNVAQALSSAPKSALYVNMIYDGPDIENFEVRITKATVIGLGNDLTKPVKAETLTFKLHGDALAKLSLEELQNPDNGWKYLGSGMPIPKRLVSGKRFDVNNVYAYGTGTNSEAIQTFGKLMPDGSYIIVHRVKNGNTGTADGLVRVLIPETTGVTPETVKNTMNAVGVANHTPPSPQQIKEMGIRSLVSSVFGYQNRDAILDKNAGDLDGMLADVSKELGVNITADDFITVANSTGRLQVRLTPEKAKEVAKASGRKTMLHDLYHKDAKSITTLLVHGRLEPSIRRWENGLSTSTGQSAWQDMQKIGAGDMMYLYKYQEDPENFTAAGRFLSLAEVMLGRTDYYAFDGDAWGEFENPSKPSGFKVGMVSAYGDKEIDFRGGISLNEGLLIVDPTKRQEIIDATKAAGRTEIDGVPIEDILVPAGDPKALADAIKKLRERFGLD